MRGLILCCVWTVLNVGNTLAQCSMCRTQVENNVSNGETSFAAGLNFGILYLFAAPYLMVMIIAFLMSSKTAKIAFKIQKVHIIWNKTSNTFWQVNPVRFWVKHPNRAIILHFFTGSWKNDHFSRSEDYVHSTVICENNEKKKQVLEDRLGRSQTLPKPFLAFPRQMYSTTYAPELPPTPSELREHSFLFGVYEKSNENQWFCCSVLVLHVDLAGSDSECIFIWFSVQPSKTTVLGALPSELDLWVAT